MFSFQFNINKILEVIVNKKLVFGHTLTLYKIIINTTFSYLKNLIIEWKAEVDEREKWTFEKMSMEQMLNDKYDPINRSFEFVVLGDASIHYLSGIADVEGSYISSADAPPSFHYYIPSVTAANNAVGITFDFIVYCNSSVITASNDAIIRDVEYYKYSGMFWQLLSNQNVINNQVNNNTVNLSL